MKDTYIRIKLTWDNKDRLYLISKENRCSIDELVVKWMAEYDKKQKALAREEKVASGIPTYNQYIKGEGKTIPLHMRELAYKNKYKIK